MNRLIRNGSQKMVSKILKLFIPYKFLTLKNIILSILLAILMLLGPHIIKLAIDKYMVVGDIRGVVNMSILYLLIIGFLCIVSINQTKTMVRLGQTILNDLRLKTFSHIQNLSMDFFDKTKQGTLISRLDTDIHRMEEALIWGIRTFINSTIILFGALYFMLLYDWRLCLAVCGIIPLIFIATEIFRRNGLIAYKKVRESIARITSNLAETISGIKITQSFVREDYNLRIFEELNLKHISTTVRAGKIRSTYLPSLNIISALGIIIILLYGGNLVIRGELKIGELSAYLLYMGMFFGPIYMLAELYNEMLETFTSMNRISDLLDKKPKIVNIQHPVIIHGTQMKGEIIFENVYFKYENDSSWILKDINFAAKPCQTIAFVGKTGSGKTSIVNLIPRFYDIQKGRILLDGHDLKTVDLKFLRTRIGIVPQESFLFTGSIIDNLKYGNPELTDEEVINASKSLGLHRFVKKLPDGYHTHVKERGEGLSLGERQLISFTRALLISPKILILDEATSAVDSHTEYILHKALEKLIKNRTSFIVAQRLSTVREADLVLVVRDGTIIERGTHKGLLKQKGIYAKMYKEFIR